MRGFRVHYRNGQTTVVNSDQGIEAETIHFEKYDELIGMTVFCTSSSDKKPRRIGFTILRNASSPNL